MSKKDQVSVAEGQSPEVKKIELDEATYVQMMDKLDRLSKLESKEDKARIYRKNRYNRIKNILAKAKQAGIK